MAGQQDTTSKVSWDKAAEENFQKILEKIPYMVRGIAETRISKNATGKVRQENRWVIMEKDMVDAFFTETPPAFLDQMKDGMQEVGIDYAQYGYGGGQGKG